MTKTSKHYFLIKGNVKEAIEKGRITKKIKKEIVGTNIEDIMTVNEAAELWGLTEGAIRYSIKTEKLIEGVDYRKAGRITLITKAAMLKVYGEPKEK